MNDGDSVEQQRFGDWLDHDQRCSRTDGFLRTVRGIWTGEGVRPLLKQRGLLDKDRTPALASVQFFSA